MWALSSSKGIAGLALVVALSGCGDQAGSVPAVQPTEVTVRAMAAQSLEGTRVLRFAGVVESRERATLTFQVGGVLRERFVELGQTVTVGEPLAQLFNPELDPARDAARERVREVEAEAEQARRDLIRAEQLFERGVLAQQERDRQAARLDALEASMGSARAGLRQSEQLQQETRLFAPFAGIVEAVFADPGEYVAAGQPVVRLAAADGLEVEVTVPARMLDGLGVGDTIPVGSPLEGWSGQGRVTEIGASGSDGGVLYPLVVGLDSLPARAGDAVEVTLTDPRPALVAVPFQAVMRSSDGLAVFRVEGGQVRRVPVTVTRVQGEWALLEDGELQVGDAVVYSGLTRLADRDAVRLLP
jgi:membrane fusion protein, multidrug efflux system